MKFLKPSFKGIGPKTITSFIASAYLVILLLIYPLYMREGFVRLDYYKFNFFLYSSLGAVLLLLLTGFAPLFRELRTVKITDLFILFFILITTISFLSSPYQNTAFLGADGWFMGFLSILLLCLLYLLISRLWEFEQFVIYALLIGTAIVSLLGFLDRFSIYLLPLKIRDPSFISTIGNINWFTGFQSVSVTIGIIIFLQMKKDIPHYRLKRVAMYIFVLLGLSSGLVQGAESVFLYWMILLFVLLILAYKDIVSVDNLALLTTLWGIAGLIAKITNFIFKDGYSYDTNGLSYRLITGPVPYIVLAIGLGTLVLTLRITSRRLLRILLGCSIGLMILLGISIPIIGILKANTELFSSLEHSLFYFDDRFGSGRGFAYRISLELISRMSVKELLLGVGPDSFAQYAYSFDDIGASLREVWPSAFLPNAHCELLSMLINEGILGVTSYLGIFITFLIAVKDKLKYPIVLAVFVSAICYLGHNFISFSQLTSTPYIFVLMAMVRSFCNEKEKLLHSSIL